MVSKSNTARNDAAPAEAPASLEAPPLAAWLARADENALDSPARRLQLELQQSWSPEAAPARWSARRALVFMILSSAAIWAGLIASAHALF